MNMSFIENYKQTNEPTNLALIGCVFMFPVNHVMDTPPSFLQRYEIFFLRKTEELNL